MGTIELRTTRQKVSSAAAGVLGLAVAAWDLADPSEGRADSLVVASAVVCVLMALDLWAFRNRPRRRWWGWDQLAIFGAVFLMTLLTQMLFPGVGAGGVGVLVLVLGCAVKLWRDNRPTPEQHADGARP